MTNKPTILDRDAVVDTFRNRILAALDEVAVECFSAGWTLPKNGTGATDQDLPLLFAEIDDQLDRIASRLGEAEVERYRGVPIKLHPFNGFHGSASIAVHFGYADDLASLKREIDDHFAEEAEHYGDRDTPPDTPSLDDEFHRAELLIDEEFEERRAMGLTALD